MRHAGAVGPCQDSAEGEGRAAPWSRPARPCRPEVRPQNPRETRPSRTARSGRQGAAESTAAGRSWYPRGGERAPITVGDRPCRSPSLGCGAQTHERGAPENPRFQPGGSPVETAVGAGEGPARTCGCGGRVPVFYSLGRAEGPCAERPKPPVLATTRRCLPCPALLQGSRARPRTLAQWALRGWRGLVPALPAVRSWGGGVFVARAAGGWWGGGANVPAPSLSPVPGTPGSSLLARLMRPLPPACFGFILPFSGNCLPGFISDFTPSAVFRCFAAGRVF